MDMEITKLAEVRTADDKKLGLTQALYHRQAEIDPKLQFYATYLEVENYEFGEVYYVPTDFIVQETIGDDKIRLQTTFDQVQQKTWFRLPDFIARGEGRKEELPSP